MHTSMYRKSARTADGHNGREVTSRGYKEYVYAQRKRGAGFEKQVITHLLTFFVSCSEFILYRGFAIQSNRSKTMKNEARHYPMLLEHPPEVLSRLGYQVVY